MYAVQRKMLLEPHDYPIQNSIWRMRRPENMTGAAPMVYSSVTLRCLGCLSCVERLLRVWNSIQTVRRLSCYRILKQPLAGRAPIIGVTTEAPGNSKDTQNNDSSQGFLTIFEEIAVWLSAESGIKWMWTFGRCLMRVAGITQSANHRWSVPTTFREGHVDDRWDSSEPIRI